MMKIMVNMPWNKTLCVSIPLLSANAGMIERIIFEEFCISPENQELRFGGKRLKSDHLLSEYGVHDNSILALYVPGLKTAQPAAGESAAAAKVKKKKTAASIRTRISNDETATKEAVEGAIKISMRVDANVRKAADEAAANEALNVLKKAVKAAMVAAMSKRRQPINGKTRSILRKIVWALIFSLNIVVNCFRAVVCTLFFCWNRLWVLMWWHGSQSPHLPNMIQIFVSMPWNRTMRIRLPLLGARTSMVERLIDERFGISPEDQVLSFGGKGLRSDQLLVEYGIQNLSTLQLFVHGVKGGGGSKKRKTERSYFQRADEDIGAREAAPPHVSHSLIHNLISRVSTISK